MPLLKVENIFYSVEVKGNKRESLSILTNISFEVEQGEIIGICGESGGGKSTLAKVIAGLIIPHSGRIVFNSHSENQKRNPIQILFQNHGEILNPFRKVQSIIDEALKINAVGEKSIEIERNNILNSVGLPKELYNRRGYQLSGGEQQRAALARLLAVNPSLLILDEPFSAQDIESQLNFVNLFKKLNKEFNLTMVCISHDLKILRNLANRIIILKKGEVIESGETNEVFNNPKEDYTKFLLSAEALNLTYDELQSQSKN
ncbi:MAG: ATP-binding cassette domain-containing protein [Ignavibacteria bacterium]|nr:ATP-binding cassette domain-containing protein [Ignavibacteria bacterium]MBT8390536.1 ATP-binding cassette domain-containing protein [Ignavibacteria bacterium]NNJ52840.1 ABC transporter ATP-binding protein [Ignavibacteriaceae bacterium]NNL21520.1 ABC transporter ATP-binding protein [Ignavibacteriaceae bacterium]